VRSWQVRWFYLDSFQGRLDYFAREADPKKKGSIDLNQAQVSLGYI
jgi:hypothetical protein